MAARRPYFRLSERFERIERELKSQKKRLDWTQGFIVAILVVCFLAFIGFTYDHLNFTKEERQRLYDKLDKLEKENCTCEKDKINSRLNNIETLLNEHASDTTQHSR